MQERDDALETYSKLQKSIANYHKRVLDAAAEGDEEESAAGNEENAAGNNGTNNRVVGRKASQRRSHSHASQIANA